MQRRIRPPTVHCCRPLTGARARRPWRTVLSPQYQPAFPYTVVSLACANLLDKHRMSAAAEVWSARIAVAVRAALGDEVHIDDPAAIAVEPYRGECVHLH